MNSSSVFAKNFAKEMDEFCERDPKNFVVREYQPDKKKFKLVVKDPETTFRAQGGALFNEYFNVVDKRNDQPISYNCRTLRANTVFYHLNVVHHRFRELEKLAPGIFDHLTFPITIRMNMDEQWDIDGLFSGRFHANDAFMFCGYNNEERVESKEFPGKFLVKRELVRQPELWFFQVIQAKSKLTSWHPICWGRSMKMCYEITSKDIALVPGVIFHEYVHLLTDYHINECYGSLIKEAYSNYFGIRYSPTQKIGARQKKEIYPVIKMSFEAPGVYKEEYGDPLMAKRVAPVRFSSNVLGEAMKRLSEQIDVAEIDALMIYSLRFFNQINGDRFTAKLEQMLPALIMAAESLWVDKPAQLNFLKTEMEKLQAEIFVEKK